MQRLNLSVETLKEVISEWTGVPLGKIDGASMTAEHLNELEHYLKNRIIGQKEAIQAVVNALKYRFLLGETNRPIGAFLFVGPSGVGKTLLAKELAAHLFSCAKKIIRFDMSEYQERHSVARFIGAHPGYVGYDEGGQLTEALKKQRFAVVLFDEIEKAHKDIFNLLLQILDDGRLTDNTGFTVDFRHTLIILTSNLGNTYADYLTPDINFSADEALEHETHSRTHDAVKEFFRPEFLNRIDKVIVFRRPDISDLVEIAKLELFKLQEILPLNISFSPTEAALKEIARLSINPDTNAREVDKIISKEIKEKLVQLIISGNLSSAQHQTINIDLDNDGGFKLQFIHTKNGKGVIIENS